MSAAPYIKDSDGGNVTTDDLDLAHLSTLKGYTHTTGALVSIVADVSTTGTSFIVKAADQTKFKDEQVL